ncbi:hypothetical protein GLV81_12590 [Phnomibacter ginsenosidimutans]|uniref:Abasic site processing protein n=1 Tax=Phnomibacter ginsenosidimutans TaxID=2676868 RepID=A0A6I6GK79_9BACT|nr:hypothetical protein GLV81_12590 [Phnomibacter ginsenosidimutans]
MCGRYSLFTPLQEVEMQLAAKAVEWENFEPRYNAAPTQPMPVITNEFPDIIQYYRWGLVPRWASDAAMGSKMMNTRTESIQEKPAFFNIFKYKRCLVLADGYYEWKAGTDSTKKPTNNHTAFTCRTTSCYCWQVCGIPGKTACKLFPSLPALPMQM